MVREPRHCGYAGGPVLTIAYSTVTAQLSLKPMAKVHAVSLEGTAGGLAGLQGLQVMDSPMTQG